MSTVYKPCYIADLVYTVFEPLPKNAKTYNTKYSK